MKETKKLSELTEEALKKSYDEIYETRPIADVPEYYRWVLQKLKVESGKKLLDVACGLGLLLKEAEKAGLETYGIDISSVAVEKAKENSPSSKIEEGSGEALPYPDDFFDYVTNLGSLEHFLHPEIGVQEMARVLKSKGKAAVLLPNSYWWRGIIKVLRTGDYVDQEQELERFATRNEWIRLLEENGLKVLETIKFNGYSFSWWKRFLKEILIPINLSYHFLFICQPKRKKQSGEDFF